MDVFCRGDRLLIRSAHFRDPSRGKLCIPSTLARLLPFSPSSSAHVSTGSLRSTSHPMQSSILLAVPWPAFHDSFAFCAETVVSFCLSGCYLEKGKSSGSRSPEVFCFPSFSRVSNHLMYSGRSFHLEIVFVPSEFLQMVRSCSLPNAFKLYHLRSGAPSPIPEVFENAEVTDEEGDDSFPI